MKEKRRSFGASPLGNVRDGIFGLIQCIICPVPVILSNKGSGDDPPNTERDNLISRAKVVVTRLCIALLAGEFVALIVP